MKLPYDLLDDNSYDRQEQIQKFITYWQEALWLGDWTISFRFLTEDEYPNVVDSKAFVSSCVQNKTACIHFLEPDKLIQEGRNVDCFMLSIIHELVHLHLAPMAKVIDNLEIPEFADLLEEPAVDAIAKAFYSFAYLSGERVDVFKLSNRINHHISRSIKSPDEEMGAILCAEGLAD